jgi:allophanate hydrolase subunit 2
MQMPDAATPLILHPDAAKTKSMACAPMRQRRNTQRAGQTQHGRLYTFQQCRQAVACSSGGLPQPCTGA